MENNSMEMAMMQAVQHMSMSQLLAARLTNKVMKYWADSEIIHRHNIKFKKNDAPIGKRIHDLWALFHPGIFYLSAMIMPFFNDDDTPFISPDKDDDTVVEDTSEVTLRPELYDELNSALNHYLYVIATAIENGGTVNSAITKMFDPTSKRLGPLLTAINDTHVKTMHNGIVPGAKGNMGVWNSLDDTPYDDPMIIHGKSYRRSMFYRASEIDPKEVKRILLNPNKFNDSQIVHIAVALSHLAAEIMDIGNSIGKFRTREHVREAAVILFERAPK